MGPQITAWLDILPPGAQLQTCKKEEDQSLSDIRHPSINMIIMAVILPASWPGQPNLTMPGPFVRTINVKAAKAPPQFEVLF